jgi:hypothetical protein
VKTQQVEAKSPEPDQFPTDDFESCLSLGFFLFLVFRFGLITDH